MKKINVIRKFFITTLVLLGAFCLTMSLNAKLNKTQNEPGYVETGIMNHGLNNNTSLAPTNPGFYSSSILRWSPETDPDAEYSRSTVPLRTGRFNGPQVNELATPGAKIMSWSNNTISSLAQGNETSSSDYAFTHWQYLDVLVGWGVGGGMFCIPQAHLIDAAHKNGVPVTALLAYPTGASRDGAQEFSEMVQQLPDGSFPVADKMAEVAYYYGFDGYVYNQECSGIAPNDVLKFKEFHKYFRKKYPNLIFNWYDAMVESGSVSYQNQVNDYNKFTIERDKELERQGVTRPYLMDDIFCNYWWSSSGMVDTTRDTMIKASRSPYDAYHAFEIQQNAWIRTKNGAENFANLLDNNGKLKTSIGFFCADSMLNISTSHEDFHQRENHFWGTSTKDPRIEPITPGKVAGPENWAGMARYVLDKSVINKLPFTTNFQTGHGDRFFNNGKKVYERPWTYKSLQDIAPTWTWMIDTDNKKGSDLIKENENVRPDTLLEGNYDFQDAFFGGNTLRFTGNLEKDNGQQIKLYSTRIDQEHDIEVELIYKEENTNNNTAISLLVSRGDNYDTWKAIDFVTETDINGWTKAKATIPYSQGLDVINGIGIKTKATEDIKDYKLKLGQLTLKANLRRITKIKNLRVDDMKMVSANEAQVRIRAKHNKKVMRYEVYKIEKDGTETFVKASPNSAIFLEKVFHNIADGKDVTLKVVPVNFNNERIDEASDKVSFTWKELKQTSKPQDPGRNIAVGSRILWTNDRGGASERIENVFDNSTDGFRKFTVEKKVKLNFIFEPKTQEPVNEIVICHGSINDGINNSSQHNTPTVEIWCSDEIEEVPNAGWSNESQDENGNWIRNKQYKLVNPKKVAETKDDWRQAIFCPLKTPVKAKYWEYRSLSLSKSHVTRLFELYLFTGRDHTISPTISLDNVELTRTSDGNCDIVMKQVPTNSTVRLYKDIDSVDSIAEINVYKNAKDPSSYDTNGVPYETIEYNDKPDNLYRDIKFENINIGTDEGTIYFAIDHPGRKGEGDRIGIEYFAEAAKASEPIKQEDLTISEYKISYINHKTTYQYVNAYIKNLNEGDTVYIYEGAVQKLKPEEIGKVDNDWSNQYDQQRLDYHKRRREIVVGKGQNSIYVEGICAGVVNANKTGGIRDVRVVVIRKDQDTGKLFAPTESILDFQLQ